MSETPDLIHLTVNSRRQLTPSVIEFILSPKDGELLPDFKPGAHVTVQTPSGGMRRYTLVNDGKAPINYVIAVKREPNGRGGSESMHEKAMLGFELQVEKPVNDFPLVPADKYLLIAGGIGITPIFSMARQLKQDQKTFRLIYCTRSADETAYLDEIKAEFSENIYLHHDNGEAEQLYDFWDDLATPDNSHIYCCGPSPLMEEVRDMSGHWPEGRVHFEDFKPVEVVRGDDKPFNVTIQSTAQTINIPADKTILEALRDAGINATSSCESGTCSTCKTRLVSGDVDHRDFVLMDDEKAQNIMICISRAASGDLVIDL